MLTKKKKTYNFLKPGCFSIPAWNVSVIIAGGSYKLQQFLNERFEVANNNISLNYQLVHYFGNYQYF